MTTKKIKNLTKEELQSICDKYKCCTECPLAVGVGGYCALIYITNKKKLEEKIEEEIEVENEHRY